MRSDGTPRPRIRLIAPGCVPGETLTDSVPSSVSISSSVPRAAWRQRDPAQLEQVVASALETRVGLHPHAHVEIAGRSAARRGGAPTREPQALAVVDAGRNLDLEIARTAEPPFARDTWGTETERSFRDHCTPGTVPT